MGEGSFLHPQHACFPEAFVWGLQTEGGPFCLITGVLLMQFNDTGLAAATFLLVKEVENFPMCLLSYGLKKQLLTKEQVSIPSIHFYAPILAPLY